MYNVPISVEWVTNSNINIQLPTSYSSHLYDVCTLPLVLVLVISFMVTSSAVAKCCVIPVSGAEFWSADSSPSQRTVHWHRRHPCFLLARHTLITVSSPSIPISHAHWSIQSVDILPRKLKVFHIGCWQNFIFIIACLLSPPPPPSTLGDNRHTPGSGIINGSFNNLYASYWDWRSAEIASFTYPLMFANSVVYQPGLSLDKRIL